MKMDLSPSVCHLCGGRVDYVPVAKAIKKKKDVVGMCYLCEDCGAYAVTNPNEPLRAMGLLANKKMRKYRVSCYALLDNKCAAYGIADRDVVRRKIMAILANRLDIPFEECNFAWMNLKMLKQARKILKHL